MLRRDRALSGSQASRVSSVVVSPDMGNLTVASDVLPDRSRAPATRVSRVDSVRARSSWRRWRSRFLTTEDRWTPRSSRETLRRETDAGHELERQRDSRVCTARVRSDTEARAGLSSELLRHSAPPARQAALVHESELARNDPHPEAPHLPISYDSGPPRSVIRFRMLHASSASALCPPGVRARRPVPMIDLYLKKAFSTRACRW